MDVSFKNARPAPRKYRFTDGLIGNLKPSPTRAYAVWDIRQPGLAVVVQPSGHSAFKFVYSFKSRPRWYHIGNAVIPVADARRLAASVMLKVVEGHDPAAEKKAERKAVRLPNWPRPTSTGTPRRKTSHGSRPIRWCTNI